MATPDEQAQKMIDNLPDRTGRSLDEWMSLLASMRGAKHGAIVKTLKDEHGVSHGYANLISMMLRRSAAMHSDDDDLVAAQYDGAKADLRPIYDKLIAAVRGFGDDVELAPKKTYVSLRRSKQFGLIQPSTRTRVDLGLKLPDTAPAGRLEASGSFNSMVSHRVRLASVDDVDEEVLGWLEEAYRAG